ncbi:MAG: amidohydrolase [Alphaproteobacteria bacterium]|nr:MAG: amidohydrolase [Alphaproteobacteria bacterium]
MPIINRMAELHDEIAAWRREYHSNPELLYDVHQTAASVARRLREFGCDEVVEGIGQTGVVGVIRGKGDGPAIGLRADMDALPIREESGKPWSSKVAGKMHACGHDGHTAMLLGAARYLAETRNFSGKAVVIFQPAEEGGAGGRAMVEDGLMTRFGIAEVYGMHNMPGLPVGHFALRPGPMLAAADEFTVTVRGAGAHAAMPHRGIDPVVIAAHCITALQTIVSRGVDPLDSLVISVTQVRAGDAHNVIPEFATFGGTVRTLKREVLDFTVRRMREVLEHVAAAFGGTAELDYHYGYPVTYNHEEQTAKAAAVAAAVAGENGVTSNVAPVMGGEDFSFMLLERPGAFIFAGNGDTSGLHTPQYDFNDELIPAGCSYWVRLVETLMPADEAARRVA